MTDVTSVIAAKSDQINALDLAGGPVTVTIAASKVSPGQEQPIWLTLEGTDKYWRPCKTTARIMAGAWGNDSAKWVGKSATLYLDPDVKWGGAAVGGIRISHLSHIAGDYQTPVTLSKAVRKTVTIKALKGGDKSAPQPTAPEDAAVIAEAQKVANRGTEAFREWYRLNPGKRDALRGSMDALKSTCAAADAAIAADPFGLPPLSDPLPSAADLAAAEAAALEHASAQGGEA